MKFLKLMEELLEEYNKYKNLGIDTVKISCVIERLENIKQSVKEEFPDFKKNF